MVPRRRWTLSIQGMNLPVNRALAQGLQQLTHLTKTLGSVLLHNANGGSGMVGMIQGNMQDQSKRKFEEDTKQVGKKSKFGHLERVKSFRMNRGTTNRSDRPRQGLSMNGNTLSQGPSESGGQQKRRPFGNKFGDLNDKGGEGNNIDNNKSKRSRMDN
nr:aurora kinase B-like [Ipomoea batatas]